MQVVTSVQAGGEAPYPGGLVGASGYKTLIGTTEGQGSYQAVMFE